MDMVGLAGLVVAIVALIVAIFGIRDVRDQVRHLLQVERNRAYTKVLNEMVWEFVEPTDRAHKVEIAKGMHEFCMLAEVLDPKRTVDVSQTAVNNEALWLAQELVNNGSATWKDDMDLEKAGEVLKTWQIEKSKVHLANIFGRQKKTLL